MTYYSITTTFCMRSLFCVKWISLKLHYKLEYRTMECNKMSKWFVVLDFSFHEWTGVLPLFLVGASEGVRTRIIINFMVTLFLNSSSLDIELAEKQLETDVIW